MISAQSLCPCLDLQFYSRKWSGYLSVEKGLSWWTLDIKWYPNYLSQFDFRYFTWLRHVGFIYSLFTYVSRDITNQNVKQEEDMKSNLLKHLNIRSQWLEIKMAHWAVLIWSKLFRLSLYVHALIIKYILESGLVTWVLIKGFLDEVWISNDTPTIWANLITDLLPAWDILVSDIPCFLMYQGISQTKNSST